MFLEYFIGWFLKYKSKGYLQFEHFDNILLPENPPSEKIELYVHIPFCRELCPYCTFHSFRFHEEAARQYFMALRQELKIYKDMGYQFGGAYIGGGTPTIMMNELVETISLINSLFAPEDISVETNPDHIGKEEMTLLKQLGVNRVSVGVQSFNDDLLKIIGRYDKYGSGSQIRHGISEIIGIVDTLNLDMIYNFPNQTRAMLDHDLEVIEAIQPNQVTFYPLMVPASTKKNMAKLMGKISYRRESLFYRIIRERLSRNYIPNSAWCFSKADTKTIDEYIVKYDQYAGIGSGALGLIGDTIYANTFSLKEYIETLSQGKLPLQSKKTFSLKEMARYTFLMKLFGLELDRKYFKKKFGRDIWIPLWLECLFFSFIRGISIDKQKIRLTEKGMYYWVIMMREFFIGVDNFREINRALIEEDPSILTFPDSGKIRPL